MKYSDDDIDAILARLAKLELQPADVQTATGDVFARPGQSITLEGPVTGLRVMLPAVSATQRGVSMRFFFRNRNPITFQCVSGLVNSAAFAVMGGTNGYTDAICDGVEGWHLTPLAGAPGSTGAGGARGVTGPAGFPGQDGQDGQEGPPGATGQQGIQGPIGPTGPNAIDALMPLLTALSDEPEVIFFPPSSSGGAGTTGATGSQGVQGPPGFAFDGEQGQQGDQGIAGPVGPTGPAGVGIQGPAGALFFPNEVVNADPDYPSLPPPFNTPFTYSGGGVGWVATQTPATFIGGGPNIGFGAGGGIALTSKNASGGITLTSSGAADPIQLFPGTDLNVAASVIQLNATDRVRITTSGAFIQMQEQNASTPTFPAATGAYWVQGNGTGVQVPTFTEGDANTDWPLGFRAVATRTSITTVTAATTIIHFSNGAFTIPANGLRAGHAYRLTCPFYFVRGATATACAVEADILIAGTIRATTGGIATATAAGNFWGHVDGWFFCFTTGVSGTGVCQIRMISNIRGGTVLGYDAPTVAPTAFTINTTIANTIDGNIEMGSAIAGCVLTVPTGIIERMF